MWSCEPVHLLLKTTDCFLGEEGEVNTDDIMLLLFYQMATPGSIYVQGTLFYDILISKNRLR
jgi:hypothetical protein